MPAAQMPPNWNPSKAGAAPKRPFRFGYEDIASATGRSVSAVQKARSRGAFDPYDLASLALYVADSIRRQGRRNRG